VAPDMSVEDFVDQCLLRSSQQLWPVVQGGRAIGTVSVSDVSPLGLDERRNIRVADIMTDLTGGLILSRDDNAMAALQALLAAGDRPVLVVDGQQIVGLLRGSDILKWVMLHQNPNERRV